MGAIILQWIDLVWLPITFFVVHRNQCVWAIGFVLCCIFCLRLQEELLISMDAVEGFTGWIEMPPSFRGKIVYGLTIMLFLLLSYYSPKTHYVVYMAAAISLFVGAFVVSMLVMVI